MGCGDGSVLEEQVDPFEVGLLNRVAWAFVIRGREVIITGVVGGPAVSAVFSFDFDGLFVVGVGFVFTDEEVAIDVVVVVESLKAVGTVEVHLRVEGATDGAGPLSGECFFTVLEVSFLGFGFAVAVFL